MNKEELIQLLLNDKVGFEEEKNKTVDMTEIELLGQEVKNIDLSGIDFSGSVFAESSFENVNFANCDLTSADFSRASLTECDFSQAILNNADFSYTTVSFCNFSEADMAGCILNEADLTDSDFSTSENLAATRFDDGTIWPDMEKLPEGFDGTYDADLSSLQDEEDNEGQSNGYDY